MNDRDYEMMSDDDLTIALSRALDMSDPVPESVTMFAKAAIEWRTLDTELAELVFDSAMDEVVGVRSESGTRQLTFRAPGVEIEVAILAEGRRRIVGQLVPPQEAAVELRFGAESHRTMSDSLGRFTFDGVPAGPISLRCTLAGDHTVQTDWLIA